MACAPLSGAITPPGNRAAAVGIADKSLRNGGLTPVAQDLSRLQGSDESAQQLLRNSARRDGGLLYRRRREVG